MQPLEKGETMNPVEEWQQALCEHITDEKIRKWACRYAKTHYSRVKWDIDLLKSVGGERVVNIGGAPYLFEWLFQREMPEKQLLSVDIAPKLFSKLIESFGFHVVAGDVESNKFRLEETYDVVVFNELIEHCRMDLFDTLRNVRDMLSQGGIVILSTPNGQSLNKLIRNARGRTGPSLVSEWGTLDRIGHMGHVREYSEKELRELFEHCGFSIERVHHRKRRVRKNWRGWIDLVENSLPARFREGLVFVLSRGGQQAA